MSGTVLCVLQARMSSARLPGKVLAPVLGEPMLVRQIERIHRARRLDDLCVATSAEPSDDPIAECCRERAIGCYRGSLDDVLDRIFRAAQSYEPDCVVRITGDCPLIDPQLIDAIIEQHLKQGNDYTSNAHVRSFPDGMDVEAISFPALEITWREAGSRYQREHVTPYLYSEGTRFKCGLYRDDVDRSAQRWVVDYPADLEFVRAVYAALYPQKPDFGRADIHRLMETRPELAELNRLPA